MKKYQVIGGQYKSMWYGESDSLRGARIIAGKNKEYWDNWQGWHTPLIYDAEDVVETESMERFPKFGAVDIDTKKRYANG